MHKTAKPKPSANVTAGQSQRLTGQRVQAPSSAAAKTMRANSKPTNRPMKSGLGIRNGLNDGSSKDMFGPNTFGGPSDHQKSQTSDQQVRKPGGRPVALMCYICGREFGTHSLQIHIKTCKKKWEIEQDKLPPKQRRQCPQEPTGFEQTMKVVKSKKVSGMNKTDMMLAMNEVAYSKWDNEALVACKNCNRTFLPDRLTIHLRSCKPADKKVMFAVNPVSGELKKMSAKQKQNIISQTAPKVILRGHQEGEETKDGRPDGEADFSCRFCHMTIKPGKLFDHEANCHYRRNTRHAVPRNAASMSALTHQQNKKKSSKYSAVADKNDWRIKHMEFQTAIKMGRQMNALKALDDQLHPQNNQRFGTSSGRQSYGPAPRGQGGLRGSALKSTPNRTQQRQIELQKQQMLARLDKLSQEMPQMPDNRIECPYCRRKFAEQTAERHIPACKNTLNKPRPPPRLRK